MIALDVPVAGRSQHDGRLRIFVVGRCQEVALLAAMVIGQRGGAAGALMVFRGVVGRRERATQREVGNPRLVQQPLQFHIGTQCVVALLGVGVQLAVGVVLRTVTANVACQADVQNQGRRLAEEGVHVVQRQDVALVGRVGRCSVAERVGVLQRGIQHTTVLSEVKTFVDGNLTRMLVYLAFYDKGRLTLAGIHLHHAVRQVAVFHRRNACHHLDALDVRRTDGAC